MNRTNESSRSTADIPLPTLQRLAVYARYLAEAIETGTSHVSSKQLGEAADVPPAQVRKDLSFLASTGRPGVGYPSVQLATQLNNVLDLGREKGAALVGVGNLGRALAVYRGFVTPGLHVTLLFDDDPSKIGLKLGHREILPFGRFAALASRQNIRVGILCVPAASAQDVADVMVEAGIRAIWNFAPVRLTVPDGVYVKNEDLSAQYAVLSYHLMRLEEGEAIDPAS